MRNLPIVMIIATCLVLPQTAFSQSSDQGISISQSTSSSPIQFSKKIFDWTDMVYITIHAPDFNSDPHIVDVIGLTSDDKVTVSTTGHSIPYQLSESGSNTGIFTGYVVLTGDPTQKGAIGVDGQGTNPSGLESTCNPVCGPTNGFLPSTGHDGITVSFEYTRDRVVTGSAQILWNVGNVQWLESNYPVDGQGVVQIVDSDMNLNPKAIDKFDTNVWSVSDSGGIKLAMTETGDNTGIFQGTVYFSPNSESSGSRLHVSQGDTVTAEYTDRTLPFPHSPADEIKMTSAATIGTTLAPLQEAPASNARLLDSLGNTLTKIKTSQQVQIASDVTNQGNQNQPFAYIVQIQDSNGITLYLSWITGSMVPKQTLNLGQSWMPKVPGTYTAQIFVWQSITNPNALSQPLTLQIQVT